MSTLTIIGIVLVAWVIIAIGAALVFGAILGRLSDAMYPEARAPHHHDARRHDRAA